MIINLVTPYIHLQLCSGFSQNVASFSNMPNDTNAVQKINYLPIFKFERTLTKDVYK